MAKDDNAILTEDERYVLYSTVEDTDTLVDIDEGIASGPTVFGSDQH
jgi:hypothetical protein